MAIWIQSLSWTLIYSLGQGTLVFAALWLLLKLVPATLASVRYHASLSALTVLFAWFGITWWQQFQMLQLAGGNSAIIYQPVSASTLWHEVHLARAKGAGLYESAVAYIHAVMPWLSAFYIIGLVLMLMRLSLGMLHLSSLRSSALSQPGAELQAMLTSLKARLQYYGHTRLFISAKAQVPMVIGFIKPIILLPAATLAQLSAEQLETILLHELAHIKRHDYLVNILQTVVETLLFFNPFAWLVSANIRREREHCCDDLVLDHTREPLSYATALAALAALAAPAGSVAVFAVAASGQSDHLFNRIKRIMEMKKNQFSYSRVAAAILIVSAITCSAAWLTPSFALSNKDKPTAPDKSTTKTTTTTTTTIDSSKTTQPKTVDAGVQETNLLVQRMMSDNLINDMNGYWVQKKANKLYLNNTALPDDVAGKYLEGITQDQLNIRVFSFKDRQQMHPDANILQLLAPTTFQSGCVEYKPKDGC